MKTSCFYLNHNKPRYRPIFFKKPAKNSFRARKWGSESEFVINRFPIMEVLAYVVAQKSGYSENMSKSLGYGVATGYAILKNVGMRCGYTKGKGEMLEDKLLRENYDILKLKSLNFCGISFLIDGEKILGLANVKGNQTSFNPEKFDSQLWKIRSIRKDGFEFLCRKIEERLGEEYKDFSQEIFGKHFFAFWKHLRDEFRTAQFFKGRNN